MHLTPKVVSRKQNPVGKWGREKSTQSGFPPPFVPLSLSLSSPSLTHIHTLRHTLCMHDLLSKVSVHFNYITSFNMDGYLEVPVIPYRKKNCTKSVMDDALANLKVFPVRKLVTVNIHQWSHENS